ncbi:MAG: autotransporter outer membrane beta-barrel domain-containing protein [Succinivibrio sp.]|nr:autotransporter outer membrane beta-barrel domain-containing protein [Succinivibrio sp.]
MAGGKVNEIKGGFAKAGEAIDNVVDLIKGEVKTVFGGNVESKDGKSLRNKVNLLGATVTKIFGGSCDTAKGNVTNLIDGTVTNAVYAGHGEKENINNVINIGSETQSDLSELHLETATLYGGKQGNDVKNEGNTLNVYGKTSANGVVDFDNYNFYNVEKNSTAHLALTDNVDLTDSKISVELAKGTNLTVGDKVNLISTQGTLTADNAAIDAGLKAKSGAVLEYSFGLDNVNNNSLVATAKTAEASGTLQDLSLSQLSGLLATKQTTEMVAYKGIPVARDVLASSKANDTFSVAPFVVASYGNNEYGDGETVKVKGADFMIGLALGINTGAGDITLGAYYDNHTGDHDTSSHFGSADGDNSSNGAGLLARFDAVQLGVGNPYAEATFRFGKMDTDTKSSSICDTQGRTLNVSNDADYVAGHFGIGYDMKFDKLGADVYAKYFFTKLDGVDVDVLGDTVKLDSVSSKTLRLGTNLSYALDSGLTPYFGLAYENESDAKAEGTVLGYKLKNTDVKGSSGLVSVGAQFTPTSAQGFSLDASLDGYFGNRQGVIGNIQASYKF